MRFRGPLVPLALLSAAIFLPQASSASRLDSSLTGTVGPGFHITLADTAGDLVTHLDPGTYTITVHDRADIHSFHLTGPGVDMDTDIEFTGDAVWTVTFVDGRYKYFCDAHPIALTGDFTVGNVPPPPPKLNVEKLVGAVGPGATISLKNTSGQAIFAGAATIVVHDKSAKDNFHLLGPGLSKKTAVAGKATVTWKVRLLAGRRYTYRSDAHAALKKTFVAKPRP